MTGTIISLRPERCGTTALAQVDVTAVELLQAGHAVTLLGARLAAIRANLLAKREQLVAVIADLRGRPPSGDTRIDAINAAVCAEASTGLSHVNEFLEQIEIFAARIQ